MIQMCINQFNLKQKYIQIAEDVNTEKNDWNLLNNIDDKDKNSIYISDMKLKDELNLSQDETNLPDSISIISH